MEWIVGNLGSMFVGLFLILIVFFIVRNQVKQKKEGGSSCGCGCDSCSHGSCGHRI